MSLGRIAPWRIMMRRWSAFCVVCCVSLNISAQRTRNGAVPCYEGDSYRTCTTAERSAKARVLANARTAAVIIEAKRTISCGDGSPDSCIATDGNAERIIGSEVMSSALWRNFDKAEARDADILLKFSTRNQDMLQLCAYGAESNEILWCESRIIVALDNDAARLLVHLLEWRLKIKRASPGG